MTRPVNRSPHNYCGCDPCCICMGHAVCELTGGVNVIGDQECSVSGCRNSVAPEDNRLRCFPHMLGISVDWLKCSTCQLSDHVMRDQQGPGAFCHRCQRRMRIKSENWSVVVEWEKKRQRELRAEDVRRRGYRIN